MVMEKQAKTLRTPPPLTLLTLISWAHLHPHRWISGEGGGGTNNFVMSDLYEDTSRILADEQILTYEGFGLYWWITPKVKSRSL